MRDFIAALFGLLFILYTPNADAAPYRLISGYLPPWSVPTDTHQPGSFIEIIREADRRLGHNTEVEILPWGRVQTLALEEKNIIISPLARLPHREVHYNWLSPIKDMNLVFASISETPYSFEEARKLGRILVQKNSPPTQYLRDHDFGNLIPVHRLTTNIIEMLAYKRAEAWFTPLDIAKWTEKNRGQNVKLTLSPTITSSKLYIAGSPQLSPEIKDNFKTVLQTMHQDGTIETILKKYSD